MNSWACSANPACPTCCPDLRPRPRPPDQFHSQPRFHLPGNQNGSTGELFLKKEFDQLLDQLRDRFDYILIDSSPVFAADDAASIAPKVDGTIFVVRNGFSSSKAVREALESLHQRQARVLGVIYNGATISASSYHQYKYTDYYATKKT
jgi:Mrp family chromosome partitioning ATPase